MSLCLIIIGDDDSKGGRVLRAGYFFKFISKFLRYSHCIFATVSSQMLSIDPTIVCYGNFPLSIVNYLRIVVLNSNNLIQLEACHATAYFPMDDCRQQSSNAVRRSENARCDKLCEVQALEHWCYHFIFCFSTKFPLHHHWPLIQPLRVMGVSLDQLSMIYKTIYGDNFI